MRRNYISPEFIYNRVNGTLNMLEQSSFFGSKMLEIEDNLNIKNDNLIYYQQTTGEQLDLNAESAIMPQILYDAVGDKGSNCKLFLDDSQTESEKIGNARWILDIQLKSVLKNYIFATLKKWRTFEGVKNDMTINQNVNSAILDYIDKNILSRYKFTKVELFIQPIDLLTIGGIKYGNIYDSSIENSSTLFTKFSTETDPNGIDIRLKFYQEKPASQFAFRYYFNLYFEKL